jgi:8-amino-7-oxononanoate synthase
VKLLAHLDEQLALLQQRGLQRRLRIGSSACGPHMQVDGRSIVAFASNDYLGLAAHPRVMAAMREGVELYGAGAGASHLISGHSKAHAALESALAEFLTAHITQARALYFGSGYLANIGVLTALVAAHPVEETTIFSADLNHASIIDGCRLSRATTKLYAHQDMAQLARLLSESTATQKIVVTDSVFSMDGTLADLPSMLALCEQHQAWLVIDDAHGFGCLGADGAGVLQHFGLSSPHLIYMGTLGKAAGVGGAFIAAHQSVCEWLLQRARSYIYTTASPPAMAHALLTSLYLIASEEGRQRRTHLASLIAQWHKDLHLQQWQRMPSHTAIQPILLGDNQTAVAAAQALYAQGLWVPAIRPPTVPAGTARLRVSLSAAHSHEQVAHLIARLQVLEGELPC